MHDVADRLAGQLLDGTYRLGERIGEGGMGAVYAARHVGTGRPVAIKVLLPQLVDNPAAVERFRREARAAGGLRHPNVVDVTDFGVAVVEDRDVAYLVMEFLEGETLRSLLDARRTLPLEVAVEIVEQVADALDAAHAAGVVHRDLKPDNVWLVPDARGRYAVRVLDFGIAQLGQSAPTTQASPARPVVPAVTSTASGGASDSTLVLARETTTAPAEGGEATTGRLTHIGAVVGTPSYMSPEQWRGDPLTSSSDTYSLGVLAHEMLAGQRPFLGALAELALAHQQRPAPMLAGQPPSVAAVVARAMAKAPGDRYPGSSAFAGCLRVAAEPAGVVLRRAIALYASRWPEMRAVAWRCARVPVTITLLAAIGVVVAAGVGGPGAIRLTLPAAMIVSALLWATVMHETSAVFALAIERLRTRPFENLDPAALAADLRARLVLPADAGWLRLTLRLAAYKFRTELGGSMANSDMAFLVRFLEGRHLSEVPARSEALAKGVRHADRVVTAALIANVVVVPLLEVALLMLAWSAFGEPDLRVVMAVAAMLFPLNAMLVNPVTACAHALLYFRARQANGELGGLGTVLQGRL